LALVRTGDVIELDVPARRLTLKIDDAELARRRAAWQPPESGGDTGYRWLYREHVMQADAGVDFDFMRGSRGHAVPRDSH
jgi:dihydroxy-acid dehydratase